MVQSQSPAFEALKKNIYSILGFDCSKYTDSFVSRRIDVRIRATNAESYLAYTGILKQSEEERKKLRKELTIHTTNFFRDKEAWNAFTCDVLPAIIANKKTQQNRRIKIWSAGSSTGEESVSIAICLHEVLGLRLSNYSISIIGTDLDMKTVLEAREAKYKEPQFREVPEVFKKKYFYYLEEENCYTPKQKIMQLISYSSGDILSAAKPKNVDVIFCRNTVIYFNREIKSKLYKDFYDCLVNGGFFIMGKTETLDGPARDLFKEFNSLERIYKKGK